MTNNSDNIYFGYDAPNPVDGMLDCASALKVVETFIANSNNLDMFNQDNGSMHGLSVILTSIHSGIERAAGELIKEEKDLKLTGAVTENSKDKGSTIEDEGKGETYPKLSTGLSPQDVGIAGLSMQDVGIASLVKTGFDAEQIAMTLKIKPSTVDKCLKKMRKEGLLPPKTETKAKVANG